MIFRLFRALFNGDDGNLIEKLGLPPETRQFITVLRVPDDPSCVVYLLTAQFLSERSARDVERLIRAAKPHAVFASLESHRMLDFLEEEKICNDLDSSYACVPDSFLQALKNSFQIRYTFEKLAEVDFTRIVFGTSYHGYVLAAKRLAADTGLVFGYIQVFPGTDNYVENPKFLASSPLETLRNMFRIDWKVQEELPQFAALMYPTFVDLDGTTKMIPGMGKTDVEAALPAVKRILLDVCAGDRVSEDSLSLIRRYRLTREYMRLLQNDLAKMMKNSSVEGYEVLSERDKLNALLVKAIQAQARRFKVVVVALDGSQVSGVVRHWGVSLPSHLTHAAEKCVFIEDHASHLSEIYEEPLPALGAAGLAVLTASKFVKTPALMLKLKSLLSTKGMVPLKLKSLLPVQQIGTPYSRVVVGLAKRRSLQAVHSSFNGVMRQLKGMQMTGRPWLWLGGSLGASLGLFWAGSQVEAGVEAIPTAISVAKLGQGMKNLRITANNLERTETSSVWDVIYGFLDKSDRNATFQSMMR